MSSAPHGSKFNTLTKMLAYLPGVTCSVALILSWKFILDPNMGVINRHSQNPGHGESLPVHQPHHGHSRTLADESYSAVSART